MKTVEQLMMLVYAYGAAPDDKHVEPLSDEAIGLISTEPMFCGCHPDFCRMVVQIVEAHILGYGRPTVGTRRTSR